MGYEVALDVEAERLLNAMPPWLQKVVEDHLGLLGKSPSRLSRTSVSPPHPPGFMVSEFSHGPVDGLAGVDALHPIEVLAGHLVE
jgi:hypothetical protein